MRIQFELDGKQIIPTFTIEMPCRLNAGDHIYLDELLDINKLDDKQREYIEHNPLFTVVDFTTWNKDEIGIYQFVIIKGHDDYPD